MDNRTAIVVFALLFGLFARALSNSGVVFGSSYCSFHFVPAGWQEAFNNCVAENRKLLCYQSEKETQDVVNSIPYTYNVIRVWLSSRNCSYAGVEKCLTLHVKRTESGIWHYLAKSCGERLPFICCNMSSDSTESTTVTEHVTTPTVTSSSSSHLITSISSSVPPPTTKESHPITTTVSSSTPVLETYCKSVFKRGILWPEVSVNSLVMLHCPGNSVGKAKWYCNSSTVDWFPSNPDMSQCRSVELMKIQEQLQNMTANATIDALDKIFRNGSDSIHGNDLVDSVSVISQLIDKMYEEISSVPEQSRFQVAHIAVSKGTAIFDRMIEMESWNDLPAISVSQAGSQLLTAVDNFGFFLARTLINETNHNIVQRNIAIEIHKKNFGRSINLPQVFPGYGKSAEITLRGLTDDASSNFGVVSAVYACYANMSTILLARRVGDLNSLVVSASLSKDSSKRPTTINAKAEILLQNFGLQGNRSTCVFWNMKRNVWDDFGCQIKDSNETHTLCECDHLTNFAVLMDFQGLIDDVPGSPLFYITVIGCSISIVSLAICIAVFSCYGRLHNNNNWNVRHAIHRNLCISLLIANIVLLVGSNQTQDLIICAVVAGLLHYFFLSAFSWMFLESIHIYWLLVVVFASKKRHNGKYYLFGYGFPLLVVGITAAIRPESYGTSNSCWLSVDKGTIWSFTGPVALILTVNFAALVLAQVKASKINVKSDATAVIKRWLRVTMILFPVLGITWVIGFLFIGKTYRVAAYIFTILNSLQGFCIFVCHCLMDKKSRSLLLTSIRRAKSSRKTTDSSPSNKNSKKSLNGLIENGNMSFITKWQKRWDFFQKPWAFCFELNLSNTPIRKSTTVVEADHLPRVVNWNNIDDSESL